MHPQEGLKQAVKKIHHFVNFSKVGSEVLRDSRECKACLTFKICAVGIPAPKKPILRINAARESFRYKIETIRTQRNELLPSGVGA